MKMSCDNALNCSGLSTMTLKPNSRDSLRKMFTSLRFLTGIQRFKLPINRCCKLLDACGSQEALSDRSWVGPLADDPSLTALSTSSSEGHEERRKKTLVLDLDETLVHSSFEDTGKHDVTIEIHGDPNHKQVYVNMRPFAREFIAATTRMYEVAIFTAATPDYANPVIDAIDAEKRIKMRLFRNYCTSWNGCFIKDLEIFDRDLKDIIIIDNSPVSYYLHPNNAIPISSWHDNKHDRELLHLLPFLRTLSTVNDVVPILSERYPSNEMDSDIARRNTKCEHIFQQQG